MSATSTPSPSYRFGRFTLRPVTRELLEAGTPLKLGERAFDLLLALVEADGRVLARDALFERVWPGSAVLDDNLKVQVMALRRLLGTEAIVTVPGRGYRLGHPVRRVAAVGGDGLIGRDDELERVHAALARSRLVTLVGSGGIGKTRLAMAAARAAAAGFEDGQLLAELAPLADATQLVPTLARALALPPTDSAEVLATALAPLSLLLVLDNAEHLRAEVAALAARLLAAAPGLRLLVTSREPLGLGGGDDPSSGAPQEEVLRLDGLACPPDEGPDLLDVVRASPAAQLFEARARLADAAFTLDEHNAEAVAGICRRLDGIPLALELAAARVGLLGARGVLARLDEPLALLKQGAAGRPERQQTLRGALAWSHGLLDADEQVVFRRLAVFPGSFDLAGAERVLVDDRLDAEAVLDGVHSLVDKSLVQVLPGSDPRRLRLLESTRAFAHEQLAAAGEQAALERRLALAMLALFEAADERFAGSPVLPWTRALLPELDNLRAALHWAVAHDAALAAALAGAAGAFWGLAGPPRELSAVLRALMPRVDDLALSDKQRAMFWMAVSNRGSDPAFSAGETHTANERVIALAAAAGLPGLQYRALGQRPSRAPQAGAAFDIAATVAAMRALEGPDWSELQRRPRHVCEQYALLQRRDWAAYAASQRRELEAMLEAGDAYRSWFVAHRLALALTAHGQAGEAEEAVRLMRRAVESIRAEGWQRQCWQQVAIHALACIEAGDAPAAPVHEAVRLMRGAGAMGWMPFHLAEWLLQRRRAAEGARVLGWADEVQRGVPPTDHAAGARERTLRALTAAAPAAEVQAWRAEGRSWSGDDVARALLAVD